MTAKTNLPANIEAQLKAQMEALRSQLQAPSSNKISTRGKIFTLPDGKSSPGPLRVIVVDFAWALVHYKGIYSAAQPQGPDCWALGRDNPDSGNLVPSPTIVKPYATSCNKCPKNQWKSDPQGKGKACKNQRRLIVVGADANKDSEPLTLYVSPGALKNFDGYVASLASTHGLLPIQVVTEVSFDANQAYPSLKFSMVEKHARLEEMFALKAKAEEMLFRPLETREAA